MNIKIREHKAGDIGWIIGKHGEIYTKEFNFNPFFEIHIANKFVDFFGDGMTEFDKVWIADADGGRAGSIAVSGKTNHEAFINLYWYWINTGDIA